MGDLDFDVIGRSLPYLAKGLQYTVQLTLAAALGTILWGTPDFSVVGAILIGSIPGILIGSHFTARMNQKVLRSSIATVLAASGLKLLGAW